MEGQTGGQAAIPVAKGYIDGLPVLARGVEYRTRGGDGPLPRAPPVAFDVFGGGLLNEGTAGAAAPGGASGRPPSARTVPNCQPAMGTPVRSAGRTVTDLPRAKRGSKMASRSTPLCEKRRTASADLKEK
jgi:hypothetical protein